jgi:IS30 family transposase
MAWHATTGLPVFFGRRHRPQDRGSNEDLNRIVREFLSKEPR